MIALRPYQTQMISEIRSALGSHRRVILQAATGSGKSLLMAEIIRRAREKNKRVLITVPKIELVDQMAKHLENIGVDFGVMQANHWRTNPAKPVQLASLQTLIRRNMPDCDLILVDEVHRNYAKFIERLEHWDAVPCVGFSATPWSVGLGKLYGKLVKPVEINDLISDGYLVEAVVYGPSKPDMRGVKKTAGDFNMRETAERTCKATLIANIHDTWEKIAKGKQTLAFAVNIVHSKQIAETFNLMGIKAEHVDAYTDSDDRREAIERFKSGETMILCSVSCLSEGFDAPSAECAILARPTASLMLHYQMIGRILRPAPGKEKAIILDHAGNFERLGFHTDETPDFLDMGDKEAKKREKKEKLPKPCPKCHFLKTEHVCPNCGFAPEPENGVHEEDGELRKITKATMTEKSEWLAMLMGYAREHGYKEGWASHKYKEKFGVWPAKKSDIRPQAPNAEIKRFIRGSNIRFKKANNGGFHTSPKEGYNYSLKVAEDGRKMIRVEYQGKFQGWATQTPEMLRAVGL